MCDEKVDRTEQSRWRPLRLLLAEMDDDIGRLYADAGIEGLKPSYVMELLRLHAAGPMTITELAESVHRTHSAMSQKVAAMRIAGLVRTTPGPDARSKNVTLTAKAIGSSTAWPRNGRPPRPPSRSSRARLRIRSAKW